jgi:glycerophosphoryl diester phosphodiesterase
MEAGDAPSLREVILHGQHDALRRLLGAGNRAADEDEEGWTPLALALFVGDRAAAAIIREYGTAAPAASPAAAFPAPAAASPYAPFHVVLPPDAWQLHVTLGALATGGGTAATPPLSLSASAVRRVLRGRPWAGTVSVDIEGMTGEGAAALAPRSHTARMRATRGVGCADDAPWVAQRSWEACRGPEPGWSNDDLLVFASTSSSSSLDAFSLRLRVFAEEGEGDGAGEGEGTSRRRTLIGEALLPSIMLTGATSTAAVSPYSAGLENLGTADAATAGPPVRLAGQLLLPLAAEASVGDSAAPTLLMPTGVIALRYSFVRGYAPAPASAPSSAAVLPVAIPAGGAPETLHMSAAGPPTPAAPLPLSRDYWRSGTRIVGHRGSGADSNAFVHLPDAAATTASPASESGSDAGPLSPASASTSSSISGESAGGARRLRGRRTHILENTVLSLQSAARAGAEYCEFDVQLTRDGIPIIHHDWTVAIPFSGSGPAPARAMASPSPTLSSSSSPASTSPSSLTLRVPVTHLTLAQMQALTPRAMIPESVADEYELAKAADAASASFRAGGVEGGRGGQGTRASNGKPPLRPPTSSSSSSSPSPSPATSAAGSSSSSGRRAGRSPLPLLRSSASVDDERDPGQEGRPAREVNGRTVAALGLDAGRADVTRLGLSYHYGLRDRFATLSEAFRTVPAECGFNIEVKYATLLEAQLFGLRQAERNAFVERILDVVFAARRREEEAAEGGSGRRPILFSSFDPDICVHLARKQGLYPVFFLTEAGTPPEPAADPRMNSIAAAVAFARSVGLAGVVSHAGPVLEAPRIVRAVQEEGGLVLATYGAVNNDPDAVERQVGLGVGAVIVDHVAHIVRSREGRGSGRR